jgi:hypothetical protein
LRRRYAPAHKKSPNAKHEAEFLSNRRNHHRPESNRIRADEKKRKLPCQREPRKSEVELRMRYRRRGPVADEAVCKVQRQRQDETSNPGDQKDNPGKLHGIPLARSRAASSVGAPVNQARIATTSRYSAATKVRSLPARLCVDHNVSSSSRSLLADISSREPNARLVGP